MSTKVVCVKVANMRPKYNDLREWMADPKNVYIARRGIVFIDGERFPKKDSKFANPFKISKDQDRRMVLEKYQKWLAEEIEEGNITKDDLLFLKGKNLGCWCGEGNCHGDILKCIVDQL